MQNNKLGRISVGASKGRKNHHNLSADVTTTSDWGSIQLAFSKWMDADSSIQMQNKFTIRAAPLNAPSFGRISLKSYTTFISVDEVTRNFDAMMSRRNISRLNTSFVPQSLPTCYLRDLWCMILFGARVTVYKCTDSVPDADADASNYLLPHYTMSMDPGTGSPAPLNSLSQTMQDAVSDLGLQYTFNLYGVSNGACISARCITGDALDNGYIYLNVASYPDLFYVDQDTGYFRLDPREHDYVDLSSADVLVPYTVYQSDGVTPLRSYQLAFKLSSFGKRLRKLLIGLGYPMSFVSDKPIEVHKMIALFKAYFDSFGLTLFDNWQSSYAYKFIQVADLMASAHFYIFRSQAGYLSDLRTAFRDFLIYEFSQMWYTQQQDFVSSHQQSESVAPSPTGATDVLSVDNLNGQAYKPNIDVAAIAAGLNGNSNLDPGTSTNLSGHAFIDKIVHGHLDSELLKVLYLNTNRETIAGQVIRKALEMQGLGDWATEQDSKFIGQEDIALPIEDVIAHSDTFDAASGNGAPLGDYAGFARKNESGKNMSYKATKPGWLFTFFAVVPLSGYCETAAPDVFAVKKFDFPHPDYDSLGMELDEKWYVQANQPCVSRNDGSLQDSFGLASRYYRWKFGRNIVNGDISLRSTRRNYNYYHLDRIIDVGERHAKDLSPVGSPLSAFGLTKQFKPSALPIAGNVWRYPTRYSWLGDYSRIFTFEDDPLYKVYVPAGVDSAGWQFLLRDYDHFIVSILENVQYRDSLASAELSFETEDDEHKPNMSVAKS